MSIEPEVLKLPFGWSWGLVPGTKAAWGARLIVTQDGMTDLLYDRQGAAGEEKLIKKTMEWINEDRGAGDPIKQARSTASDLLKSYTMSTRKGKGFVLYEDDQGAVIGNTNGSAGYLYIAAYLYEALPEGHPTNGTEMARSFEEE